MLKRYVGVNFDEGILRNHGVFGERGDAGMMMYMMATLMQSCRAVQQSAREICCGCRLA